jgi:hypothetical protein
VQVDPIGNFEVPAVLYASIHLFKSCLPFHQSTSTFQQWKIIIRDHE